MNDQRKTKLQLIEELKQLRKLAEERLSLALECTGIGLWDQNFTKSTIYRSKA